MNAQPHVLAALRCIKILRYDYQESQGLYFVVLVFFVAYFTALSLSTTPYSIKW
jgi:hypothetical protein